MRLNFELETLGYLNCKIQDNYGNEIKIFHSSDYHDKFQELINDFFIIKKYVLNDNTYSYPYKSEIEWRDTFIAYKWKIYLEEYGKPIRIEIVETSTTNSSNHLMSLISEYMDIDDILNDIFISLDNMLKKFGLLGYKKNWEIGNFPIAEYIILKAEKDNLILKEIDLPEDEEWRNQFRLQDELQVISSPTSPRK